MLDEAYQVQENSRLSCQIPFSASARRAQGHARPRVLRPQRAQLRPPPRRTRSRRARPSPRCSRRAASIAGAARARALGQRAPARLSSSRRSSSRAACCARAWSPGGASSRSARAAAGAVLASQVGQPSTDAALGERRPRRAAPRSAAACRPRSARRGRVDRRVERRERTAAPRSTSWRGEPGEHRAARSTWPRRCSPRRPARRRPSAAARRAKSSPSVLRSSVSWASSASSAGRARDRLVDQGIAAAPVGAELDQLGGLGMGADQLPGARDQRPLLGSIAVGRAARQRAQHVDRREAPVLGDAPVEHDVAVEDRAHRIGDRVGQIVALDQDREQAGDAAGRRCPARHAPAAAAARRTRSADSPCWSAARRRRDRSRAAPWRSGSRCRSGRARRRP